MTIALTQLNWIGVLAATIAAAVLGGVYFGALAPQAYARALGRTELPRPTTIAMVGPPLCMLVTVLASAVLVAALDLTSIGDAVAFSLVVGVGYLLAMTVQIAINPNFPHPLRYALLNAPYFLAVSLVTGLLLVLL